MRYNVLVTGIGAIIGYGIVQSLKKSKHTCRVVGMDIYPDAVGQYWCDAFERSIPANDEQYIDFLRHLMQKHNIDLVLFGTEQEIYKVNENREMFGGQQGQLVLNNPELIRIAQDKWVTHKVLSDQQIPCIKTVIEGTFADLMRDFCVPMLLKPRHSYASKGIQRIYDEADFAYWQRKLGNEFMIQEIVGTDEEEYTVAVFGIGAGKSIGKISLQRKLSGEGATAKAKVVNNSQLNDMVDKLVGIFKPVGPTNFQFRFHEGEFLLLEVNPRISSSTSLRTAFGYNEAEMCLDYYLHQTLPSEPDVKAGQAIRFIEDMIIC